MCLTTEEVYVVFVPVWDKMFQDIWQRHEQLELKLFVFPAGLGWQLSGQTVAAASLKDQPQFVQMFPGTSAFCAPALCGLACHTGARQYVVRHDQYTKESFALDLN